MNSSNFDINKKICRFPRQKKSQYEVAVGHEVSYPNGGGITIDNYRNR